VFPPLHAYRFTSSKKAKLLETLKKIRFSGQLLWSDSDDGKTWTFYFYLGRILYATGGTHPVRRWARNLAVYCPQIQFNITAIQRDLYQLEPTLFATCWEYQLFGLWITQDKISKEQAEQAIKSVLFEVLFDLSYAKNWTHQIKEENAVAEQIVWLEEKQLIAEVQQLWQALWNAKITDYSLDKAPIIKRPEQLKESTSDKAYQSLNYLLDGEKTLRDIAVQMKRDVVQVTRSLLPYLKAELVELISIPDLQSPVYRRIHDVPLEQVSSSKPVIACVDDSPSVCQTMESLIGAAGYKFIGINDGLRSLTILLAKKPDLIFLDLIMPNTNGYEICSQLRKAPSFQHTPIVMLTGSDGIVDQVRAKLVGASDFLSKPVDAGKVLGTIRKHLQQGANISPRTGG
ncbi:MAG: response regulator, partial [Coleofasciculaceae cyanobacterium]